ncbi:hematopoietic progenitor cell antigen CD34-like isoform X2 [Anguilla anguilla]|uniref:hematopoietic progenitor cell antigen CD34-like isoform X2 n=1 Tax=Anguilla anguilla TaxID=7936 RepID=UPI0015B2F43E|nr:hematopoietic progenitor cell antigen CD34-like isoform X2 [Anguilla anguilla]
MAGTSQRRMNGSWVRLALATVFCLSIFHSGVLSQDATDAADGVDNAFTIITLSPELLDILNGNGDPTVHITAANPGDVPTTTDDGTDPDAAAPTRKDDAPVGTVTVDPHTEIKTMSGRGDDGPPVTQPAGDIQCVDKEALKDRDAVKLMLKDASSCEETKAKFKELMGDLCGSDCDIKIYQEDSSAQVIVSGEADANGMVNKFNSPGIKEKLGVVEASPRWGKHPPTVLVALLLTGLLLAALLIGGYCLRNHRSQQAKSTKLEPQDKPSANGESPEGVKTEAPPTNGHSAAKSPVADTEL